MDVARCARNAMADESSVLACEPMATAVRPASTREVRTFGATLLGAAVIIAWIARRHGYTLTPSIAAGAFAVIGVFALIAPTPARPIHRAWMRVGHLFGMVTTPIVLTIVFVLVLTPARMLLTLFGRDPLNRKRDPSLRSYWNDRPRRTFGREDFERLS